MISRKAIIKSKRFSLSQFIHDEMLDNSIKFVEEQMIQQNKAIEFVEQPVGFREFIESKDHMDFPPLSERQYQLFDFMIGDDPQVAFSNNNSLAILAYGKGSGKDALCVLMLCYICYLCLCMRSPQAYFKQPEGENLDCVNVAPSGAKANEVFFEKLRQRILRWRWLRDKYPVRNSGAFISQVKPEMGGAFVTITKDGILFPKQIRLLSKNSDNESAEGLNILAYFLDEASAFQSANKARNAAKIYRNLKSSSTTRFGMRGKGFILSYPREIEDFTMQMYRANLGNLHVYADKAATWEVKPLHLFSGQWFDFEDGFAEAIVDGQIKRIPNIIKVPLEFKDEFDKDPTSAKMMFMADPPETEHGFFEYPEKITECIDPTSRPVVDTEDYINQTVSGPKVCKRITSFASNIVSTHDHIITIDLGRSSDKAALGMYHREAIDNKPVFVQDLITCWVPDRKNKYMVSFTNVREFIQALAGRFSIAGVWFDQWQSASMQEELAAAGIPAFEYNLDLADYKTLKEMIYTKRCKLLPYAPQILELKQLVNLGHRVDHPQTSTGSKDAVDTITGAIKVWLLKHKATNGWGEVETIEENLHCQDPWGPGN
jgi:hypothetical protein